MLIPKSIKWGAAFFEWVTTWLLVQKDGRVSKEDLRQMYDVSEASWPVLKNVILKQWSVDLAGISILANPRTSYERWMGSRLRNGG